MINKESIEAMSKEVNSLMAKLVKKQNELEAQLRLAKLEEEDRMLFGPEEIEVPDPEVKKATVDNTVEVLLDTVPHDSKPQGSEIGRITKALPNNKVTVSIQELSEYIKKGCSFKASVLTSTTKDSFVSSNLVALDVDNKESYTTMNDFIKLTREAGLIPCMIYETFSSTKEHERFRVLYRFDKKITDPVEMTKLYMYVWDKFEGVDIDRSVDIAKILFGGNGKAFFNNSVNKVPDLSHIELEAKKTVVHTTVESAPIKIIYDKIEVNELTILQNLNKIAHKYESIENIDIKDAEEWVDKNVKMTDVLGIEENARFRCILPKHEDKHPSARIIDCEDGVQRYMCTCKAKGYSLITLISNILGNKGRVSVLYMILDALEIDLGSAYQKKTERFLAQTRRMLISLLGKTVHNYLLNRKLFQTYKLLIDLADSYMVYESLGKDNEVFFFMSKKTLRDNMELNGISGSSNAIKKLNALCELGLIRCVPDEEINETALRNAYASKEKAEQLIYENAKAKAEREGKNPDDVKKPDLNRASFYELVELCPDVIERAEQLINSRQELGVRQKNMSVERRANIYGEDFVLGNVNVQSSINGKQIASKVTKVENAAKDLLDSQTCFSEDDLRKAISKKNHRINKKQAEKMVLDCIPVLLHQGLVERIRVNSSNRKTKGKEIPMKYKSNSFVYVKAQ